MSNVASLRQIRRRIRSVENTKKITRAMEMVAAAKLRRFQDFLESARPYAEKMAALLERLLQEQPADYHHPFLTPHPPLSPKRGEGEKSRSSPLPSGERVGVRGLKSLLVVFTSDTGLCGTYNSDVEAQVKDWLEQNQETENHFVFVGKHGFNALHKKARTLGNFFDLRVSRVDEILEGLRKTLEESFLGSGVNEVWAIYTRMESLARFGPVIERLLPIIPSPPPSPPSGGEGEKLDSSPLPLKGERVKSEGANSGVPPLIEPNAKTVLDKLLPAFFEARLRFIAYHALLTEQIARMNAMRQATQNAEEMIDELTLARNKARQAAITKEIIEIVSGSRALKLK